MYIVKSQLEFVVNPFVHIFKNNTNYMDYKQLSTNPLYSPPIPECVLL